MTRIIQRSALTDALIAQLKTSGKVIGDAEMPRGGVAGWIGQPNSEGTNFIAYSVVTPVQANMGDGPLFSPGSDVNFGYVLTSYGVSRKQCEDQADTIRLSLASVHGLVVDQWAGTPNEYGRTIQSVIFTGYGPVQRMGDTDPKFYGQSDTVSLWTTG
jgi:hypothetical protein